MVRDFQARSASFPVFFPVISKIAFGDGFESDCVVRAAGFKLPLRGDVFTKDVIETWLGYKRDKEIDAIWLRPHPYEFHLYYDI